MTVEESRISAAPAAGAVAEVTRTVEDYFLGWYDAEPDRMRRALHPDLAKRSYVRLNDTPAEIRPVTAAQMMAWTAEGEGRTTEPAARRLEIVADEIHGSISTARVDSVLYREYIHLARVPFGWQIVNTLWTWTDTEDAGAMATAEVTRTVEDYFLGWYDADADRMTRALHPDLVKRGHSVEDPADVDAVTTRQMIDWTAAGRGRRTDPDERRFRVEVDDIHGSIATARVHSVPYREYLHLARTPDGWRIVNALWTRPDGVGPEN